MATAGACRTRLHTAAVVGLALLLTGCGPANTAAPSARSTASTNTASGAGTGGGTGATTSAPPASLPAVAADDGSWNASGPSFGVDRAEWPKTTAGAKKLLASLPEQLAGKRLELNISPQDPGPSAAYGKTDVVFVTSEDDLNLEGEYRAAAYQLVQVNFAMGSLCLEGTQHATIPVLEASEIDQDYSFREPEPGVNEGSIPGWFSCRSRSGEEPDQQFERSQALGWASGEIAWQLYARDEKAARSLVTALHEAAR